MKFNIGDKLRVIHGGNGAYGCNGWVGLVTNEKANNGLVNGEQDAFNIKFENGQIWRVSNNGAYELIKHNVIKLPSSNVHIYEHLPYILNTIVKNKHGEIIQTQQKQSGNDTYKVIYSGLATIVILSDGTKAIAKCNPFDKYSVQIGHDIAFKRARIKQLQKELKSMIK